MRNLVAQFLFFDLFYSRVPVTVHLMYGAIYHRWTEDRMNNIRRPAFLIKNKLKQQMIKQTIYSRFKTVAERLPDAPT